MSIPTILINLSIYFVEIEKSISDLSQTPD